MAHQIAFELVVLVSLLFLNGLLAMAELAIVTARHARLEKDAAP